MVRKGFKTMSDLKQNTHQTTEKRLQILACQLLLQEKQQETEQIEKMGAVVAARLQAEGILMREEDDTEPTDTPSSSNQDELLAAIKDRLREEGLLASDKTKDVESFQKVKSPIVKWKKLWQLLWDKGTNTERSIWHKKMLYVAEVLVLMVVVPSLIFINVPYFWYTQPSEEILTKGKEKTTPIASSTTSTIHKDIYFDPNPQNYAEQVKKDFAKVGIQVQIEKATSDAVLLVIPMPSSLSAQAAELFQEYANFSPDTLPSTRSVRLTIKKPTD